MSADNGANDGTNFDISLVEHRAGCILKSLLDNSPECCHSTRAVSTCSCHDQDPKASRAADGASMMLSNYSCNYLNGNCN